MTGGYRRYKLRAATRKVSKVMIHINSDMSVIEGSCPELRYGRGLAPKLPKCRCRLAVDHSPDKMIGARLALDVSRARGSGL